MGIAFAGVLVIGFAVSFFLRAEQQTPDEPRYTSDGKMLRPTSYREWIWLTSGLGMSYRPPSEDSANQNPSFDNVFVNPAAYRGFQNTGLWPDKTVLVLEVRNSASRSSINQSGHFQQELAAVEVHVKDEKRFPGKWAFFGFGKSAGSATMIPVSANCYSCHEQSGATDTTFVQFYPTLIDTARKRGTFRADEQAGH